MILNRHCSLTLLWKVERMDCGVGSGFLRVEIKSRGRVRARKAVKKQIGASGKNSGFKVK